MPLLILTLLLCSCSPRPVDHNNALPRYSDMSAAEDAMNAGKAK